MLYATKSRRERKVFALQYLTGTNGTSLKRTLYSLSRPRKQKSYAYNGNITEPKDIGAANLRDEHLLPDIQRF